MASNSSQKKQVILNKPEDWDTWIAFVKIKAANLDIWDQIDPDLFTRPPALIAPVAPVLDIGATFDQGQWNLHLARKDVYKTLKAEYKEQKEAFAAIISFIHETVSAQNAILIQHVESPHPYDMLRCLKSGIAPTDTGRKLQLRARYEKLRRGPGNQNIEAWINDYQQMYYEATASNLPEVQGDGAISDFLLAYHTKHPSFADSEMSYLNRKPGKRTMHQYIDSYRQHARVMTTAEKSHNLHSSGGEHSAFAAGRKTSENAATFRGNKVDGPTCVCGKKHWYGDCFYYNPAIKPAWYKENPEVRAKVNETLQDPAVLNRVKISIAKSASFRKGKDKEKATSSSSTAVRETAPSTESKEKNPSMTFATFKVLATKSSVQSIVVLDCAADIHVCNEAMRHRYTKERDAAWDDRVLAGEHNIRIESFGSMELDVDTPTGPSTVTLLNVAFIPKFLTSIASMSLFEKKEVHFDTQVPHLHRNGETVIKIYKMGGHYTFKQSNQQSQTNQVFATAKKSRTATEWHSIMAHASPDAIMQLEKSSNDYVISDISTAKVPKTHECETCALTKSHVHISRTPNKSETSETPFYRVSFDLMQFDTAMNGDQWCFHLACLATNFNLAYTHRYKSDARNILQQAFALIKTRYNGTVVFLRVDGETSLNTDFLNELKGLGITYEATAPYTPV